MLASLCAIFFFNFVFASSWLICLLRCAFAEPFSDTTLWNLLRKCARRLGVVWGLRCVSHTNLFGKCLFTCHAAFSYALCSLAFFLPLWGSFQKPTSLTRLTQGKMGQTATKAPVCPLPTAKLAQRPSRKRKKPKMLAALPNKACPGAPAQPCCGQNDLDRCPANCGMLSYSGIIWDN